MPQKLLTFPELRERGVPHGRRHVDRLEADDKFPKRVPIGEHRVAWVAAEIDEYVKGLIAKRSTAIGKLGSAGIIQPRNPAKPGSRRRGARRDREHAPA